MEKQIRLVQILLARSKSGSLAWQQTAIEDVYQVSFANNSIQISEEERFATTSKDYVVEIINDVGQTVETFNNRQLDDSQSDAGIANFFAMKDIFNIAKRKALGSDEALNDVLSALEKL